MSKHTPGPWDACVSANGPYAITWSVWHGDAYKVFVADVGESEKTADETEANAHLIAAAPDLLAALLQIQRTGYTDIGDRMMVDAAIAKATGDAK